MSPRFGGSAAGNLQVRSQPRLYRLAGSGRTAVSAGDEGAL